MQTLRALFVVTALAAGCGSREVDCEALCQRTLECEVTFGNTDDPSGEKIRNGERTEEEACVLGCGESENATVEAADCVDRATNEEADLDACHDAVVACFA